MSLFKILRNLDQKFSWSFLGFLVAVLFGTITVYDRFIAVKHPQVYFDVITSTAVLDIREDLPKLEIFFSGINIREQKLSLRVVSIKVINEGPQDILKGIMTLKTQLAFEFNRARSSVQSWRIPAMTTLPRMFPSLLPRMMSSTLRASFLKPTSTLSSNY